MAQAQAAAAGSASSAASWSAIDVEGALARETEGSSTAHRRELALALAPDAALLRMQSADARLLAAEQRVVQVRIDAASTLRERHAAYQAAFDVARLFRDDVVPLRKTITDEMLLRYNGMLTGVFALLADARAQVGAVIGAIEAQRDFWVADAALDAAVLGAPSTPASLQAVAGPTPDLRGGH